MGALQSSGPISLNDIHVEVQGTTETICSINDADIRELIPGKDSGDFMSFSMFYGKAASLDRQVVTVGNNATGSGIGYKRYRGYAAGFGSIDDGTCNFKNLANITKLYELDVFFMDQLVFELEGNFLSNPGFETLYSSYNEKTYHINDLYSSGYSDGKTFWTWDSTDERPFGSAANGYSATITFR